MQWRNLLYVAASGEPRLPTRFQKIQLELKNIHFPEKDGRFVSILGIEEHVNHI